MAISKWIKHWLGIDEDIEDIKEEVLENVRKEMEKRTRQIIHDEYTHYKEEASLTLEALTKDLLSKLETINSRLEELEGLAHKMHQIEEIETRISTLEHKPSKDLETIKTMKSSIESSIDQITNISTQSSEVLKEIKDMKNDVESGIGQFKSELGQLVKSIVDDNFMTYLNLPEGSIIATSRDLFKVDNDLSEINKKIDQDNYTVIKICDFLVKIFGGNTEAFKNCFQDSSNELLPRHETDDTTDSFS